MNPLPREDALPGLLQLGDGESLVELPFHLRALVRRQGAGDARRASVRWSQRL
ncbi:MAG TPA: hypothetical protein VEU33_21600 [Archangium sp.]|nr:hypothetical protein [Archangium sp.]